MTYPPTERFISQVGQVGRQGQVDTYSPYLPYSPFSPFIETHGARQGELTPRRVVTRAHGPTVGADALRGVAGLQSRLAGQRRADRDGSAEPGPSTWTRGRAATSAATADRYRVSPVGNRARERFGEPLRAE